MKRAIRHGVFVGGPPMIALAILANSVSLASSLVVGLYVLIAAAAAIATAVVLDHESREQHSSPPQSSTSARSGHA